MDNLKLHNEFKALSLTDEKSMKRVHLIQLAKLKKMFENMDDTKEFLLKSLEE